MAREKRRAAAMAQKKVQTIATRELDSEPEDAGIIILGSPPPSRGGRKDKTRKGKDKEKEDAAKPIEQDLKDLQLFTAVTKENDRKRLKLSTPRKDLQPAPQINNRNETPKTPSSRPNSNQIPKTPASRPNDDSPSKDSDATISAANTPAQLPRVQAVIRSTKRRVEIAAPSHLRTDHAYPAEIFDDIKHLAFPDPKTNAWDQHIAQLENEKKIPIIIGNAQRGVPSLPLSHGFSILQKELGRRTLVDVNTGEQLSDDDQDEEFNQYRIAVKIAQNLQDHFIKQKQNAFIRNVVHLRKPVTTPTIDMIALGKIKSSKPRLPEQPELFANWNNPLTMSQMDNQGCTFCWFECDYGICDERCLLPEEASRGYCTTCYEGCDSFSAPWDIMLFTKFGKDTEGRLSRRERMVMSKFSVVKNPGPLKELAQKSNAAQTASLFTVGNRNPIVNPIFENWRRNSIAVPPQVSRLRSLEDTRSLSNPIRSVSAGNALPTMRSTQREGQEKSGHNPVATIGKPGGITASSLGGLDKISSSIGAAKAASSMGLEGAIMGMMMEGVEYQNAPLPNIPGPVPINQQTSLPTLASGVDLGLAAETSTNAPHPPSSPAADVADAVQIPSSPAVRATTSPSTPPSQAQNAIAKSTEHAWHSVRQAIQSNGSTLPDNSISSQPLRSSPLRGRTRNSSISSNGSMPLQANSQTSPARTHGSPTSSIRVRESQNCYPGPTFCRGNPFRQVDVNKVRICQDCRNEKFEIAKHRHLRFNLLVELKSDSLGDSDGEWGRRDRDKNCMICFDAALYKCEGCPLRLCGCCQTLLTLSCKGYVGNLMIHYDKTHLRNDAFLLRGDNYGY